MFEQGDAKVQDEERRGGDRGNQETEMEGGKSWRLSEKQTRDCSGKKDA